MAIYHFHQSYISRHSVSTVCGHAAYIAATRLYDQRTGLTHDYRRKSAQVIASGLLVPEGSPRWAHDRETLWNAVEAFEAGLAETRFRGHTDPVKDAKSLAAKERFLERALTGYKSTIALPGEITDPEQLQAVAIELVTQLYGRRGLVADYAIHAHDHNPHLHIQATTRPWGTSSVAGPTFSGRRYALTKEVLGHMRAEVADVLNQFSVTHGYGYRVDHRSYEAQGLAVVPTYHRGWQTDKRLREGKPSRIAADNEAVRRQNVLTFLEKPDVLLRLIAAQKPVFTAQDVEREMLKRLGSDPTLLALLKNRVDGWSQAFYASMSQVRNDNAPLNEATYEAERDAVIQHFVETVLGGEEVLSVGINARQEALYTTRAYQAREATLTRHIEQLRDQRVRRVKDTSVAQAMKAVAHANALTFSAEQQQAIWHLMQGRQLVMLTGRAGTGKTTVLKPVVKAYQDAGLTVWGTAFQGKVVDMLARDLKIPAYTLDKLIHQWHQRDALRKSLATGLVRGVALQQARHRQAAYEAFSLTSRHVIVVDEANMVSSAHWQVLLTEVLRTGAQLRVIGDNHQLKALQGADIATLMETRLRSSLSAESLQTVGQRAANQQAVSQQTVSQQAPPRGNDLPMGERLSSYGPPTVLPLSEPPLASNGKASLAEPPLGPSAWAELTQVHRQRVPWMAQASQHFNAYQMAEGLALYAQHGHLTVKATSEAADWALVMDYLQAWHEADSATRPKLKALAFHNTTVAALNAALRLRLQAQGFLGVDVFSLGDQAFAIGDHVMLTRNDYSERAVKTLGAPASQERGVKNGSLGIIEAYEPSYQQVTVRLIEGRRVAFRLATYAHLTHSYALTIHKAEGETFEQTFVRLSPAMRAPHGLIACTRHQGSSQLYTSEEEAGDIKTLIKTLRRSDYRPMVYDTAVTEANRAAFETVERYVASTLESARLRAEIQDTTPLSQSLFHHEHWPDVEAEKALQATLATTILADWQAHAPFLQSLNLSRDSLNVQAGLKPPFLSEAELQALHTVKDYFTHALETRRLWETMILTHPDSLARDHPSYVTYEAQREARNTLAYEIKSFEPLYRPFWRLTPLPNGTFQAYDGTLYERRPSSLTSLAQQAQAYERTVLTAQYKARLSEAERHQYDALERLKSLHHRAVSVWSQLKGLTADNVPAPPLSVNDSPVNDPQLNGSQGTHPPINTTQVNDPQGKDPQVHDLPLIEYPLRALAVTDQPGDETACEAVGLDTLPEGSLATPVLTAYWQERHQFYRVTRDRLAYALLTLEQPFLSASQGGVSQGDLSQRSLSQINLPPVTLSPALLSQLNLSETQLLEWATLGEVRERLQAWQEAPIFESRLEAAQSLVDLLKLETADGFHRRFHGLLKETGTDSQRLRFEAGVYQARQQGLSPALTTLSALEAAYQRFATYQAQHRIVIQQRQLLRQTLRNQLHTLYAQELSSLKTLQKQPLQGESLQGGPLQGGSLQELPSQEELVQGASLLEKTSAGRKGTKRPRKLRGAARSEAAALKRLRLDVAAVAALPLQAAHTDLYQVLTAMVVERRSSSSSQGSEEASQGLPLELERLTTLLGQGPRAWHQEESLAPLAADWQQAWRTKVRLATDVMTHSQSVIILAFPERAARLARERDDAQLLTWLHLYQENPSYDLRSVLVDALYERACPYDLRGERTVDRHVYGLLRQEGLPLSRLRFEHAYLTAARLRVQALTGETLAAKIDAAYEHVRAYRTAHQESAKQWQALVTTVEAFMEDLHQQAGAFYQRAIEPWNGSLAPHDLALNEPEEAASQMLASQERGPQGLDLQGLGLQELNLPGLSPPGPHSSGSGLALATPTLERNEDSAHLKPRDLDPVDLDPANPDLEDPNPKDLDPMGLNSTGLGPAGLDPTALKPEDLDSKGLDPEAHRVKEALRLRPQMGHTPTWLERTRTLHTALQGLQPFYGTHPHFAQLLETLSSVAFHMQQGRSAYVALGTVLHDPDPWMTARAKKIQLAVPVVQALPDLTTCVSAREGQRLAYEAHLYGMHRLVRDFHHALPCHKPALAQEIQGWQALEEDERLGCLREALEVYKVSREAVRFYGAIAPAALPLSAPGTAVTGNAGAGNPDVGNAVASNAIISNAIVSNPVAVDISLTTAHIAAYISAKEAFSDLWKEALKACASDVALYALDYEEAKEALLKDLRARHPKDPERTLDQAVQKLQRQQEKPQKLPSLTPPPSHAPAEENTLTPSPHHNQPCANVARQVTQQLNERYGWYKDPSPDLQALQTRLTQLATFKTIYHHKQVEAIYGKKGTYASALREASTTRNQAALHLLDQAPGVIKALGDEDPLVEQLHTYALGYALAPATLKARLPAALTYLKGRHEAGTLTIPTLLAALQKAKLTGTQAGFSLPVIQGSPQVQDGREGDKREASPLQAERLRAGALKAARFWQQSQPVEGTVAETYLRHHRGIQGPLPPSLRFLPQRWVSPTTSYPALLAFATDAQGIRRAYQETFLNPLTAQKATHLDAPKRSQGAIKGSAVKVQEGTGVTYLAEGLETALSLKEAGLTGEILAVLGQFNMGAVTPSQTRVVIAGDYDGPNHPRTQEAMAQAAASLRARGYEVSILWPTETGTRKCDFNDLLKEGGAVIIQARVRDAQKAWQEEKKPAPALEPSPGEPPSSLIKDYIAFKQKLATSPSFLHLSPAEIDAIIAAQKAVKDMAFAITQDPRLRQEAALQGFTQALQDDAARYQYDQGRAPTADRAHERDV